MRHFISFVLLGLFASLVHAIPTSADEEHVLTPGGLRPKSQVHSIPPGGRVQHTSNEILLIDENNNILHRAPRSAAAKKRTGPVPEQTGWVTYASWYDTSSTSPISSFTTTWTVPPAPVTNHGQTLFLFNSIEPASGDAIVQPVLQYGPSAAGGGSFWSIASWYVIGSSTYTSSLVDVSSGTSLQGSISLTSQSGGFSYTCTFTNHTSTSIQVQDIEELVWATETLEVYSTTTGSDYPKGSTTFSNINIKTAPSPTGSSSSAAVSWNVVDDTTDSLITTVMTNGATNANIVVRYPTS